MKSAEITEQGQHTLSEIFSQPQCWNACLAQLAGCAELHAASQLARAGAEWIFVGCGTSYYLAQAAASSFNYLKLPARAVPASDLVMYPALTLHAGRDYVPVVISRSGRTSEAIRAAQILAQEHPEWLILDKNGKHARMTRGLAVLCPAVPEVRAYHKQLTEKFIRDWGFDGSKLDNIYSVPACYNPAHHHQSPQDSVNAMGDVYKEIFQTTRALKPQSVTQSCPCGTPPSLAWLPFMDQAVTADPVWAVQGRRRIQMDKAFLGPTAAGHREHGGP